MSNNMVAKASKKRAIYITEKFFLLGFTLVSGAWVYIARNIFLDDTFIFLTYGRVLLKQHIISTDGITLSFPSDPLYVFIAAFMWLFPSPETAIKTFTILIYATLLAVIARRALIATKTSFWLHLLFLAALVAPLAARWLTDGMETSLFAAICVGFGLLCQSEPAKTRHPAVSFIVLALAGFFAVLLRIEALYVIAFVSVFLFARGVADIIPSGFSWRALLWKALRHMHLTFGALSALLVFVAYFGYILPDTAIAKHNPSMTASVQQIIVATGSSMSYGCLLWITAGLASIAVFVAAIRCGWRKTVPALVLLAFLPVGLALIVMVSMRVEGIRHINWLFMFSISALITFLNDLENRSQAASFMNERMAAVTAVTIITAAALFWTYEVRVLIGIAERQKNWIDSYRATDWRSLNGVRGIAFDVGLPMYFSEGRICDVGGLVNGRSMARATVEDRIKICAASNPQFLVVDPGQYDELRRVLGAAKFAGWSICNSFKIANVRETVGAGHLLIVSPTPALKVCPASIFKLDNDGKLPASII
jgi:hypothetical protein